MYIVFFAISGFLITMSVLDDAESALHPVRTTLAWVVKRMLRMWPAMLAGVFFGWLVGDFNVNVPRLLLTTLTFNSNHDVNVLPYSFVTSWSNCVDVKVGAFLCLVAAVAKRYGHLRQSLMYGLLGIAILLLVATFFSDPEGAGLLSLMQKNIHKLVWTPEQQAWLEETYHTGVPMKPFFEARTARRMYLSSWARCSTMLIGGALALRLRDSDANPKPRAWWRFILAALLFVLAVLPSPRVTEVPKEFPKIPLAADLIFTVGLRPLVAFAWCEVLYASLVAPSHPAHCAWLEKVLSWRPFQRLADYTHPFYLFHYRICMSIVITLLHPSRKHVWGPVLGEEFGFAHLFVCAVLGVLCSSVAAYLVHNYCEKPVWRKREVILKSLGLSAGTKDAGVVEKQEKAKLE